MRLPKVLGVADRRDELAAETIDIPFSIEQNHPRIQQHPTFYFERL